MAYTFKGYPLYHKKLKKRLKSLDNATFTRSGVAYGETGSRVVVTNLLTDNQATGGDALNPNLLTENQATGGDALGTTAGFNPDPHTTVEVTTEKAYQGNKSIKISHDGEGNFQGVYGQYDEPGESVAFKVMIWAPVGLEYYVLANGNYTPTYGVGNGEWQEIINTDAHTSSWPYWYVRANTSSPTAFYIDALYLHKKIVTGFTGYQGGIETLTSTTEEHHQGDKSLKVTTTDDDWNQGILTPAISLSVNTPYTLKGWVKAPLGKHLRLQVEDSGYNESTSTFFEGTGEWQEVEVTHTTSGTERTFLFTIVHRSGLDDPEVFSFYIDELQWEIGSVAHEWGTGEHNVDYGDVYETNEPRFNWEAGDGLMVEEATTNILTANQSTGGDTSSDTTGFSPFTGGDTVEYTTTTQRRGAGCIKVVTANSAATEGVYTSNTTTDVSSAYTASCYVWGSGTVKIGVNERTAADADVATTYSSTITLTGTPQQVFVTRTLGSTGARVRINIVSTEQQAITFYVDMLQLEKKLYPTSWHLGGATRNAEVCSLPSTVLNAGSTSSEGTIEFDIYMTPPLKSDSGSLMLIYVYSGTTARNQIQIYRWDTTVNKLRASISDDAGNQTFQDGATATDNLSGWQKIGLTWSSAALSLYLNGGLEGTTNSPYLPASRASFYIGGTNTTGHDVIIRNVTVSRTARSASEIAARAASYTDSKGYLVDKYVTGVYKLQNDLTGKKVATV